MPLMLIPAHARRNRLRTLLTAGSVAVALFLFCGLRTVITSIDRTVSEAASGRLVVQSAVSLFVALPISQWKKVEAVAGGRPVTHWTWFAGVYQDPKNFFARFATDVPSFRKVYGDRRPGGGDIAMPADQWDAWEGERTGCIIGRALVDRFGLKIGDVVPIEGNIYPGEYRFTIRGIYRSLKPTFDEGTMFFHWDYLDETNGGRGLVSTYTIDLEYPEQGPEVARKVDEEFASSANRTQTLTEQAFQAGFVSMWGNVPLFLSFIGGAVLFAACMVTVNTLLLNARERVTEVGVLKTLGFPDASIGAMNVIEGLLLSGAGGAAGCGLAWVAFNLSPMHDVMGTVIPDFTVLPRTVATAMAIALGLGLVSGLIPGIVAARMPVVRALRRIG